MYVQRGADPDLMVQRPDGRHVMVAMSWTDYARSPGEEPLISPPPLLDVGGLQQAAQLIERMRQEGRYPSEDEPPRFACPLPKPKLKVKPKI